MPKRVAWFSAGASSFYAAYIAKPDEIIYIHIDDQHDDTLRYVHDCEKLLGKEITILQSRYKTVDDVIRATGFVRSPYWSPCSDILKRRVRKEWEENQSNLTYIWGFDLNEKRRAGQIYDSAPEMRHEFPLISEGLTKPDVHAVCARIGLKRPKMYDMGYSNNNCVGCIRGGMGYWNKIRKDFPDVFKQRAETERFVGATCLKECFLDELDPNRGRMSDEIMEDCGMFCHMQFMEDTPCP